MGRIFITRLISSLALFPDRGTAQVPAAIFMDVNWWLELMKKYNGVSMLWLKDQVQPSILITPDMCLMACRGNCGTEYFHFKFPDWVKQKTEHISQLELFTIVFAMKLWADKLCGNIV